jgi:hypothetical protein
MQEQGKRHRGCLLDEAKSFVRASWQGQSWGKSRARPRGPRVASQRRGGVCRLQAGGLQALALTPLRAPPSQLPPHRPLTWRSS